MTNIFAQLLILINLLHSILCLNSDVTTHNKFIANVQKLPSPVNVVPNNNRVSKLRLILLSDIKQNEIPQTIDTECWASSQTIKITAKQCPCNQINCNAPANEIKRRAISVSCMQFCCGGSSRYRKPSIRSISEAQIQEIGKRKFSLKANCERFNYTDHFVFSRIYDMNEQKTICAGVLVHQKFIVTTAICAMNKKPNELLIKFGSYRDNHVQEIIIHPNFYNTIQTLQHNIALMMIEKEVKTDLPCIMRTEINNNLCHVFSWSASKFFENAMKLDNVEVLTKGECYTSHLIAGKKQEKYVNKGVNNICVGNDDHRELNIHLSGSALTCHSTNPNRPQILKGLLTWATEINVYPHLFTDITQFDDWIESTVNAKLLKHHY